jgi:hypothetical protein
VLEILGRVLESPRRKSVCHPALRVKRERIDALKDFVYRGSSDWLSGWHRFWQAG